MSLKEFLENVPEDFLISTAAEINTRSRLDPKRHREEAAEFLLLSRNPTSQHTIIASRWMKFGKHAFRNQCLMKAFPPHFSSEFLSVPNQWKQLPPGINVLAQTTYYSESDALYTLFMQFEESLLLPKVHSVFNLKEISLC